jgi:hypothetical protein
LGIGYQAKVFCAQKTLACSMPKCTIFARKKGIGIALKFLYLKTVGAIGHFDMKIINENNKLINQFRSPIDMINEHFAISTSS